MSSQGARWAMKHAVNPPPAAQPVLLNISSEHFDRENSKMTQHYDSYLRTFNEWMTKLASLPFKLSLSQLKETHR